jgi:hypothetical protein
MYCVIPQGGRAVGSQCPAIRNASTFQAWGVCGAGDKLLEFLVMGGTIKSAL